MKIRPEHYAKMKSEIARVLTTVQPQVLDVFRKTHSEKRFRWDLMYAAKLTPFICNELYPYANDEHIDTALRAIVRELTETN